MVKVEKRVRARKPRPSNRKIGVKLHRPLKKTGGFRFGDRSREAGAACFKSQAAQIGVVGLRIVCWFNC